MTPEVGTGQFKKFPFLSNYHPPLQVGPEIFLTITCAKFKEDVYTSGPIESGPWIKDLESFFPRLRLLPSDERGACKPVKSLTGCVLKQPS